MTRSTNRQQPIAVGERLPWSTVTTTDGRTRRLRQARTSHVVVVPHEDCPDCADYLAEVATLSSQLTRWNARALSFGDPGDIELTTIAEPAEEAREALGIGADEVAVLAADRYGIVWNVHVSSGHDLPAEDELVDQARFLGIQCPECETLDSPVYGVWDDATATGHVV